MRESIMLSPAANFTSLCVSQDERTERLSKTLLSPVPQSVNPLVHVFLYILKVAIFQAILKISKKN